MRNEKGQFVKGHKPWHKGKELPDFYKKILSDAHVGNKASKGTKAKMSKARKGRPCTWKEKIGKANFKTGQHKSRGYVLILNKKHPFTDKRGYVKRARLVMETHLRRFLEHTEPVHHINGIKDDDRIENLQLFANNSEHQKFHYRLRKLNKLGQFT